MFIEQYYPLVYMECQTFACHIFFIHPRYYSYCDDSAYRVVQWYTANKTMVIAEDCISGVFLCQHPHNQFVFLPLMSAQAHKISCCSRVAKRSKTASKWSCPR